MYASWRMFYTARSAYFSLNTNLSLCTILFIISSFVSTLNHNVIFVSRKKSLICEKLIRVKSAFIYENFIFVQLMANKVNLQLPKSLNKWSTNTPTLKVNFEYLKCWCSLFSWEIFSSGGGIFKNSDICIYPYLLLELTNR